MKTEDTYVHNTEHSIGIRLRHAREQLGLSQREIAERLHLKVSTVRDIEEDRVPSGLASTFLRGYIRSYAKFVRIPENELLLIINQESHVKDEKTSPIQQSSLGEPYKKYDKWLTIFSWLIFFIVLAITTAWWWQNHKEQQKEIAIMGDNQPDFRLHQFGSNTRNLSDLSLNDDNNLSIHKPKVPAMLLEPVQEKGTIKIFTKDPGNVFFPAKTSLSVIPEITIPLDDANSMRSLQTHHTMITESYENFNVLEIRFIADCWIEITNEPGKNLFSGLRHRNENLFLVGQTPYQIKIGAPEAVRIQFQGKPIDIGHFIKTKQVVRLVFNAE